MKYEFEVLMHKCHHNRGDFIYARHLGDKYDFEIPKGALFGDVPVYLYKLIRPGDYEDSAIEYFMYVFQPVSLEWLPHDYFKRGQKVTLAVNDSKTD